MIVEEPKSLRTVACTVNTVPHRRQMSSSEIVNVFLVIDYQDLAHSTLRERN
jgi:hypothetical protein